MYSRKGLSDIVTNILIILLVLVAVGIIWAFVRPTINQGAGQLEGVTSLYGVLLEVEPSSVTLNTTQEVVSFVVKRTGNDGEMSGMQVILTDAGAVTKLVRNDSALGVLESRRIYVDYTGIGLTGAPVTVSVAPLFAAANDEERTGLPSNEVAVSVGTGSPPGSPLSVTLNVVSPQARQYNVSYLPYPVSLILSTTGPPSSCDYALDGGSTQAASCTSSTYVGLLNGGAHSILARALGGVVSPVTQTVGFSINRCVGDVNGDGRLTFADGASLTTTLRGIIPTCSVNSPCAADVNGNQVVNAADAQELFFGAMLAQSAYSGSGATPACVASCYLDCDGSGDVNLNDKTCFQDRYDDVPNRATDYYLDANGVGGITAQDVTDFNFYVDDFYSPSLFGSSYCNDGVSPSGAFDWSSGLCQCGTE